MGTRRKIKLTLVYSNHEPSPKRKTVLYVIKLVTVIAEILLTLLLMDW